MTGGLLLGLSGHAVRSVISLAGVALITVAAHRTVAVNPITVGFGYLLLVLVIATFWGFLEACTASVAAALAFNFFFLPPVGTLTIADPENWVALFSFLATSLIASRLSDKAERRAQDAIARRQDLERLYSFSRAILLIDETEAFPKQLAEKLASTFPVRAVVLYDGRSGEFYRAGPSDFNGLDDQLKQSALEGGSFADPQRNRVITAVRLGARPIASLAIEGPPMPDAVLQGIANLVAIGLERAVAQDLANQVEAAKRSQQLRTSVLDAMSHEFKTPLTSIRAATTALLADPDQAIAGRMELLKIADEEAEHLRELIDDSVEMARLDDTRIELHLQPVDLAALAAEVVAALRPNTEDRRIEVFSDGDVPAVAIDRRLLKVALRQILDNALKYSPPRTPVEVRVSHDASSAALAVTDRGKGIPVQEQDRIFERFYRGPAVRERIPGSGLGLSIASSIVRAHHGGLTLASRPGETTFRITLPLEQTGAQT